MIIYCNSIYALMDLELTSYQLKRSPAKIISRQSGPGKVKTAPSLFTSDTSSINYSIYHMIIMHAYEVQIYIMQYLGS